MNDIYALIADLSQNPVFAGIFGAGMTGVALVGLRSLPRMIWRAIWWRIAHTIEVVEGEETFRWLDIWLSRHPYAATARNMRFAGANECHSGIFNQESAHRLSPGIGVHFFRHHHSLVVLTKHREEGGGESGKRREIISMTIVGGGRTVIADILREAQAGAQMDPDHFRVMTTGYDGWYNTGVRRKRALSSVILAEGQKERIVDDIRAFTERREWYHQRGIPYRRGYAFIGKPGCGKSSAINAIAGAFFSNVHILSLASVKSDKELSDMVSSVANNGVLVIEDIDTVFHGREMIATALGSSLTFGGLLNALDGISTSDGLVVFISANHPEHLDPALIRPGRIDVIETFGLTSADQARRMFMNFFPGCNDMADQFASVCAPNMHSPAEIQGILISNAENPIGAVLAMKNAGHSKVRDAA